MRTWCIAIATAALLGSCTRASLAPARDYAPTITRDQYGIPSIHGRDDQEAAYGIAYAHAEDNFATIQLVILAARGRLGAHLGEDGARSDFLWHLLGVREAVEEGFETRLSEDFRAVAQGYADGINAYAAAHPREILPGARNVTARDVVAGSALTVPLFWGFERTLGMVADEEGHPCATRAATGDIVDNGSNAFAVSPRRSADGHTRLIINSHQPWAGPVAWYEASVTSDTGWRMHGGLFPGSPFPVLGTNGDIGFAATVNLPDLADIYRLTTDDQHRGQYFFDGAWRRFETRTIWLQVKIGPITIPVPRTLRFTEHGPAFETADGWVAVRYAGRGEIRALEQFYRMGRAQNYEQWREAMSMRSIPSFNFIYADATGRIAYHYNAILPRRAEGYDWSGCVPGDTSANIWAMDDRLDAPTLVDPSSGWLYSTNGARWSSTDPSADMRPEQYPEAAPAIETYITNRGYRAVEILSPLRTISDEQLLAAKFDLTSSERSATMAAINEILAVDSGNDAEFAEIQTLLRTWDRRAAIDSPAAALAGLIYQPIYNAGRANTTPPTPVEAARTAAAHLRQHFGRLDPPLGDVLRLPWRCRSPARRRAGCVACIALARRPRRPRCRRFRRRFHDGDGLGARPHAHHPRHQPMGRKRSSREPALQRPVRDVRAPRVAYGHHRAALTLAVLSARCDISARREPIYPVDRGKALAHKRRGFWEVRMRTLVAASALVLLAACGQQQQQAPAPEAPVATGPTMPDWSSEYVGRAVSEAWPNGNRNCTGYVDSAEVDGAVTRVTGWAWDRSASSAFDRLISVGADGIINGAGTTTTERPDVIAGNTSVTNARVGFEIVSNATSGTLRVAALDLTSNTACWVGQITY